MKVSVKQLRQLIKEVLNEMPYMRPHHMRGIGPELDSEPGQRGKLTTDQMMRLYPEAADAFWRELQDDLESYFGEESENIRYPKDALDGWNYYVVKTAQNPKGVLVMHDGGAAWTQWDPMSKQWGDVHDGHYPKGVGDYGKITDD